MEVIQSVTSLLVNTATIPIGLTIIYLCLALAPLMIQFSTPNGNNKIPKTKSSMWVPLRATVRDTVLNTWSKSLHRTLILDCAAALPSSCLVPEKMVESVLQQYDGSDKSFVIVLTGIRRLYLNRLLLKANRGPLEDILPESWLKRLEHPTRFLSVVYKNTKTSCLMIFGTSVTAIITTL